MIDFVDAKDYLTPEFLDEDPDEWNFMLMLEYELHPNRHAAVIMRKAAGYREMGRSDWAVALMIAAYRLCGIKDEEIRQISDEQLLIWAG